MVAPNPKPSRSSPKAAEFPSLTPSSSATSTSTKNGAFHRVVRKPSVGKQPLVPLSEARQYGLQRSASSRGAAHKDAESEKWEDNASAARDGRQFAVSNVGNNGRIYLRYVSLLLFQDAPCRRCLS